MKSLLNPLIPSAFTYDIYFVHFGRFSAWIRAKLAPIYSKRQLQHDSTPFFPMTPSFTTILLRHAEIRLFGLESDLCLEAFWVLLIFFHLSFSSFCDLFAAVTDFLQGLLPVEKFQFTQSCIFVHISGSRSQSLERPFPPADLEYR